jgi:hypothetical protein
MAQESSHTMLQFQAPRVLAAAVKLAADREMTTISEFVRRVLLDRLRSEGIDPAILAKGTPQAAGADDHSRIAAA